MHPSTRSRLAAHLRTQWAGLLALFLVIAGGTAYAANTIGSSDIIDGQVKTADIGNNQVYSADVRNDTLANGGLTGADIVESSLGTVPGADTLDGRDSRDFARFGGLVNGDGTILQGSGFTVSRLGDGEYQVSFPAGTLSNAMCPPVATAMPFTGIVRHPQVSGRLCSGLGAGAFTVKMLDNDGVPHDTPFVFMAM